MHVEAVERGVVSTRPGEPVLSFQRVNVRKNRKSDTVFTGIFAPHQVQDVLK